MKKQLNLKHIKLFGIIVFLTFVSNAQNFSDSEIEKAMKENGFLKEWTGPFNGVPAFDKTKVDELKQAMKIGMQLHLDDIDAIANNPKQATFANTIVEMESAGEALDRVFPYYGILRSNMST
ncbi:MAG: M3 family peptidase, partial [Flavobacteriaceae bacterium]|nr:M3 family peptidase [Flavobacteriaceae bacterium]